MLGIVGEEGHQPTVSRLLAIYEDWGLPRKIHGWGNDPKGNRFRTETPPCLAVIPCIQSATISICRAHRLGRADSRNLMPLSIESMICKVWVLPSFSERLGLGGPVITPWRNICKINTLSSCDETLPRMFTHQVQTKQGPTFKKKTENGKSFLHRGRVYVDYSFVHCLHFSDGRLTISKIISVNDMSN